MEASSLLHPDVIGTIGIAIIGATTGAQEASAIASEEQVETVIGECPSLSLIPPIIKECYARQSRTYKHPIFSIDVALAVGIPITTNVMTMITPHRATGTGPVNGMMIGTLRDAIAIAARAIIMMVGDVIALTADLEAQEDVRGIGELGKLDKHISLAVLLLTDGSRSRSPQLTEDERDRRTVFVQQLAARLRTKELITFFEKVGPVKEAQIVKDRVSGRSKGYVKVSV